MKVRSILVLAILFASAIGFYSCEDSHPLINNQKTNVQGYVRGYFSFPIANAKITINNTTVMTDINGGFNFGNVQTPYDIYVNDSSHNYQTIYKEVCTSSPYIYSSVMLTQGLGDYAINVHGPVFPTRQKARVSFIDDDKDILGTVEEPVSNSYNIFVNAPSGLTLKGRVILITYTVDYSGVLTDFKYFAIKNNVLLSQGTATEVTFSQSDLDTVSSTLRNCTVNVPQGSSVVISNYLLNFSNHKYSNYLNYASFGNYNVSNFNILIPNNLPISFTPQLYVFNSQITSGGDIRGMYNLPNSNVTIDMPPSPTITAPVNEANNVDVNTVFSFQKQSISNIVIFALNDSASGKNYRLCTKENSITLGMLSQMVTLKPNTRYSYTIIQVGTDGCATVGTFLENGRNANYFSGTSEMRFFTTKP